MVPGGLKISASSDHIKPAVRSFWKDSRFYYAHQYGDWTVHKVVHLDPLGWLGAKKQTG